MSDLTLETNSAPPAASEDAFDLSSLAFLDTAEMEVVHPVSQEPTGWVIQFAGPGHPESVKLSNETNRKLIKQRQAREEAQINGRKWHAEAETPEANTKDNATYFAKRMIGWYGKKGPVRLDGRELPFSRENAVELLMNPKYGWLYRQVTRFVMADEGFIPTSETD